MKKFYNLFNAQLLIACFITFLFNLWTITVSASEDKDAISFCGGTGTTNNPYLVCTAAQLDGVRENLTAHYKLGNDINLDEYLAVGGAGYAQWGAEGWLPIGTGDLPASTYSFTGSFDGAGYTISGLRINKTAAGTRNQGLFGYIYGATIQNLGVNVASIRGYESVGGITGYAANNATIENCYVTGAIYGYRGGGGVVGGTENVTISKCYTNCNVTGSESLGGLIGLSYASSMLNCYATGSVASTNFGSSIGGLVGQIRDSNITLIKDCYANNRVEGLARIGGIAGFILSTAPQVEIRNSYALNPEIETYTNDVGRIVGLNQFTQITLVDNYALESMNVIGVSGNNSINGTDISECGTLKEGSYPQEWFGGVGAWTFTYTYNSGSYNVTEQTNLPILRLFNQTNFPDALQVPYVHAIQSTVANLVSRDTVICSEQSVNLTGRISSVNVIDPVFKWYTTETGNVEVPSLTVSPSTTTTYYVSVSGANFCEGKANSIGRAPVKITVNTFPAVNLTKSAICVGSTTTVTPASGGTWDSSNPSVASVTNTGLVTGLTPGSGVTFIFTHNATGCKATTSSLTVNALPTVGLMSSLICMGDTTTVTPTSGGTWVSSNPSVAAVTQAGVVTGVTAGVGVTFTYTNNTTGCSATTTPPLMVHVPPTVGLTLSSICVGSATTVTPASGGTWESSAPAIATVTNAGVVTGIAAGTGVTFTFTNTTTGCSSTTTPPLTVNALPTVSLTSSVICVKDTTTVMPTNGGTWASSNPSIATVTNTGTVTGVAAGSGVIFTFTHSTTGCSAATTPPLAVSALPVVSLASSMVCVGGTTTVAPASGGTWASSNVAVASVTNSGTVTGITAGSGVTFTFTNSTTGCSATTTTPLMVHAPPTVGLTVSSICIGDVTTVTPASGGMWDSSDPSVASVTNAGVVTGLAAGSGIIFIFTNTTTGCSSTTTPLTVHALPTVNLIKSSICVKDTTIVTPTNGGTWVSSNPAIASVANTGVVAGVAAGSGVIFTYTHSTTGCSAATTTPLTVHALPSVSLAASMICIGATTTVAPASGGTWTSSNPAVATVTNTGTVTGITSGSGVTFTFTNSSTGCSATTTTPLMVHVPPTVDLISSSICVGDITAVTPASGGTWTSSDPSVATVTNAGVVTGLTAGNGVTFTFTNTTTGCSSTTTTPLTVHALPTVSLASSAICVGDTTTVAPASGGTWESSNAAIATVTNAGVVISMAAGSGVIFTFTHFATGCSASTTTPLTVYALPSVSLALSSICVSSTTTVAPASGGTWASSNPAVATVTNAGVVTGVTAGSGVTFTFTNSTTGCKATTSALTVTPYSIVSISYPRASYYTNDLPAPVTLIGIGAYTDGTYTVTPAGLSIDANSGTITPKASNQGIYTITYTFPQTGGCGGGTATDTVTIVNAYIPNANNEFEIWNWDDMAHISAVMASHPTVSIFKLMQPLGIPNDTATYGDGTDLSLSSQEVRDVHKGDKRFGWWGYEGFTMPMNADDFTVYDETASNYQTLIHTRKNLTAIEYTGGLWTRDNNCGWEQAEGWVPVGVQAQPFTKVFEGNGYSITDLWINRTVSGTKYQGLFGAIRGATIQNLGVNIKSVRSYESVGGIAGFANNDAIITHCYVTGNIYGYIGAGGVAGNTEGAIISSCYTNCDITGRESLGGLVGISYYSSMLNCYTTGSIIAESSDIGGLVGHIDNNYITTIKNCYANNSVEGMIRIGGIAGYILNAAEVEIINSYALNPRVEAYLNEVGRIVGRNESAMVTLEDTYALDSMLVVIGFIDDESKVIHGTDLPKCEIPNEETYPQAWFAGVGAWTFDYSYNSGNYNVTAQTNLPILKLFNQTDFPGALQIPYVNAIKSTVANLVPRDTAICNGQSIDLTECISSIGVIAPVFKWYFSETGNVEVTPLTVSPSTTTTYYVSVSGANFCEGKANSIGRAPVTITINDSPTATISYPLSGSFCITDTVQDVIRTGAADGVYSASPAGLTIDAATGQITPASSLANTYTVTYSIPVSNSCSVFQTTTQVTIILMPSVTTLTYPLVCILSTTPVSPTMTGTSGGTYSYAVLSGGTTLTLDSITGVITPSTSDAGVYRVTYTTPTNSCGFATKYYDVTVQANGNIGILRYQRIQGGNTTILGNPLCVNNKPGNNNTFNPYPTSGTAFPAGSWSISPSPLVGFGFNTNNGAITFNNANIAASATYTITYTPSGGASCPSNYTFKILVQSTNANITTTPTTICNGASVDLTTLVEATNVINPVFRFYTQQTNYIQVPNPTNVTPTGTTSYFVSVSGDNYCEGANNAIGRRILPLTVQQPPTAPTSINSSGGNAICIGASTNLSATGGGIGSGSTYRWGTGAVCGSDQISETSATISVNPSETTTYWVRRVGIGQCAGRETACAMVTITVNPHPESPLHSAPICKVMPAGTASVTVTAPTGSGYQYFLNGFSTAFQPELLFDTVPNGIGYTITVKDNNGCTTTGSEFDINCNCNLPPTITLATKDTATCVTTAITISKNSFGGSATAIVSITTSENANGNLTYTTASDTPFVIEYVPDATDAGKTITIYVTTNNPAGAPCVAATDSVTITIMPLATVLENINHRDTTICSGGTVNLNDLASATGEVANPVFKWYTTQDGSTEVLSTTVSPIDTITYYVSVLGDNLCEGLPDAMGRAPVTVNVIPSTTASIAYPRVSYYSNDLSASVSLSGTNDYLGGTYTASPEGLSMDANSGTITPKASSPDIYTITYTIPETNECGGGIATTTITIENAYIPNINNEFEIWNWDDFAHIPVVMKSYPTVAIFKLMQHLGIPDDAATYGDGTGLSASSLEVRDVHKGDKRFGWWGYEGFIMPIDADDLTVYNETYTDYQTLVNDRKILAATEYSEDLWIRDDNSGWEEAGGWIPVCNQDQPFTKIFEGNGYAATGLWMNRPSANNQALFGFVNNIGAEVKNLGVHTTDSGINGNCYVAGIVAQTQQTTITHSYVTGTVNAVIYGGGVAGWANHATINQCYTNCTVSASNQIAGGIAADVQGTTQITDCYTTGDVYGEQDNGGIAGRIQHDSKILRCYALGNVSGNSLHIGGIAGNAFHTMDFTGTPEIRNCYAFNAQITNPNMATLGRILGHNASTTNAILSDNYALDAMWLNTTNPEPGIYSGNPDPADKHGGNISACKATFKGEQAPASVYTSWSFNDIWTFNYNQNYHVVTVGDTTNLPILSAFNKNIFTDALQIPHLYYELVEPSIAISADTTIVCANDKVEFSALLTNPCVNPTYQWRVNGVNVGQDSAYFTYQNPQNNAAVTCFVFFNDDCAVPDTAISNAISVTVKPLPDAPNGISPQEKCAGDRISDLAITGTDIKWYDAVTGGNPIVSNPLLEVGVTYYASQTIEGCESENRLGILVLSKTTPLPEADEDAGIYCGTATVANLRAQLTSNYIINIFHPSDLTTPLEDDEILIYDLTYYINAVDAGCASIDYLLIPVVHIGTITNITGANTLGPEVPEIELKTIGGPHYVWTYQDATVGTTNTLTVSTGGRYIVTVTDEYECSSTDSIDIKVTLLGTIFPFVKWNVPAFDSLFPVTVSLKQVPDPLTTTLDDFMAKPPVISANAEYHDGSVFIERSPFIPGIIGSVLNPGEEIEWGSIILEQRTNVVRDLEPNEEPDIQNGITSGLYRLESKIGEYVLEIKCAGYVVRWLPVLVTPDGVQYLGHREIIAGDINQNRIITQEDVNELKTKMGGYFGDDGLYDPKYDLNSDGRIDQLDYNIIVKFLNFQITNYKETRLWIEGLGF
jgi:hypothetical protein